MLWASGTHTSPSCAAETCSTSAAWCVSEAELHPHASAPPRLYQAESHGQVGTDVVDVRIVLLRCEGHGGMMKQSVALMIAACVIWRRVCSKEDDGSDVCLSEERFDPPRRDSSESSQSVLVGIPRVIGHILKKEELGVESVLEQTDSVRATCRLASRISFVKQNCSSRRAHAYF